MSTGILSTRIDEKILKKLDKLSEATHRSKAFLASEAIKNYIKDQSWQIEAIKEGLKEADKGNFASDKEIKSFFSKWGISDD